MFSSTVNPQFFSLTLRFLLLSFPFTFLHSHLHLHTSTFTPHHIKTPGHVLVSGGLLYQHLFLSLSVSSTTLIPPPSLPAELPGADDCPLAFPLPPPPVLAAPRGIVSDVWLWFSSDLFPVELRDWGCVTCERVARERRQAEMMVRADSAVE